MQEMGANIIELPPPSASVDRHGFMPTQLYDFNTPYGSDRDLRTLVATARDAGLSVLADVVINHRCADEKDETGNANIFRCASNARS
jgi:alpha-amylase